MFRGIFQPMHWIMVLGVVLLIFGPKNIGQLGAGLGKSIRDFKKAISSDDDKAIEVKPESTNKE
ncbi:MAG: twin-arginine translocase TatA/TatE family subunit [Nitrospirae bacterium]|nr:twin-arginine translocase TatA/TatE family subunit [Nitrospirota bacterium]